MMIVSSVCVWLLLHGYMTLYTSCIYSRDYPCVL